MVASAPDAPDGPLRALRVLETLAGMAQPASLDVIVETTSLTRTKTYRALRFLQDAGFIDHIGRDGYQIGSRSLALATLIGPRPALLAAARPVVRWLAELTSESATLNLRSGSHRVQVTGIEARDQPIRGAITIGERAPLTSGCSGTAILAYLPLDEADEVLATRPPRERSLTADQMATIRRDGYALSFSDNHVGVNGISAPLLAPADGYPSARCRSGARRPVCQRPRCAR